MNREQDFDSDLSQLADQYESWLKADRVQAACVGAIALVVWLSNLVWIIPTFGVNVSKYVVGAFALLAVVASSKPITDANAERDRIDQFVSVQQKDSKATAA